MRKALKIFKSSMGLLFLLFAHSVYAAANQWQMNMPKGVTPIAKDMYNLHMTAIIICAIIGVLVFGVMIYSLIHHRKAKGYTPATFYENTRLEIIWTIIPFIILIGLAVPATRVLIQMNDFDDADLTIKIVGYQWKWQYQYLDEGISYFSNLATPFTEIQNKKAKSEWYLLDVDKPLVLPINMKIRFLVTSNDVIHSWWVPELGVKRDAIPGFIHEAWARIDKIGTYRGQCTELCGVFHGFMPIVVKAVSEEDFQAWVAAQPKMVDPANLMQPGLLMPYEEKKIPPNDLMAMGKLKYEQFCSACHQVDGSGIPPLYPALKASSVAVGNPISRHIDMILNGVSGSAMQAFKDQLSDDEIAAIVTFERNAWGNNTGDVVQPGAVTQRRYHSNQPAKLVDAVNKGGFQ